MKNYLKLLGQKSRSPAALETTSALSAMTLSSGRAKSQLEVTQEALAKAKRPAGVSARNFSAARKRLLQAAPDALDRLVGDGPQATLRDDHRFALEAIVHANGTRTAFYIKDDGLDLDEYEIALGTMLGKTKKAMPALQDAARSVGRIDAGKGSAKTPKGTCFAIAPNRVATNLHVLQQFASRKTGGRWGDWEPDTEAVINFKGEKDAPGEASFKITHVLKAGAEDIGAFADPLKLDLAILEVEPLHSDANFPEAMVFDAVGALDDLGPAPTLFEGREIYVLGFPADPNGSVGQTDLHMVFGGQFDVKHWAPGEVIGLPDDNPADLKRWIFSHDASTLAGNSGSLIMDFQDLKNPKALGLHFGGLAGSQNQGHILAELAHHLKRWGAVFRPTL